MPTIREAGESDLPSIVALLEEHDLRPEGVLEPETKYWIAEEEDSRPIGAIGIELGETSVLLRSAVVAADCRGQGIGRDLTSTALNWAQASGYQRAYCFSTDAGDYWVALGFKPCSLEEILDELADAPQVQLFTSLDWLPEEAAYRIVLSD